LDIEKEGFDFSFLFLLHLPSMTCPSQRLCLETVNTNQCPRHGAVYFILASALGIVFVISFSGLVVAPLAVLATDKDVTIRKENATVNKASTRQQDFQSNRSLALIHIGKAGGLTLRAMTSLNCRLPRDQITESSIQECLIDTFGSTDPSFRPLALQTIYYAHMNAIPHKELSEATSLLISLRNPVDRLVSAYRYSHPANCQDNELLPNSTKGCTNRHILRRVSEQTRTSNKNQQKMEQQLTKIFVECFPGGDVEELALSVEPSRFSQPMTKEQEDCSRLARAYIIGKGPVFPIPHFRYNYQHYWNKALQPYVQGNKEWFGIRTEHLWHDFRALNHRIGGRDDGIISATENSPVKLTHGSEKFQSSTLSPTGYQNLCCLLKNEITIYTTLIQKMWNFNNQEKLQAIQDIATKCGMLTLITASAIVTSVGFAEETVDWENVKNQWEQWHHETCPESE